MQGSETLSGILPVDKPQGFTSHDVVAKLRGILHIRRIGHGGTLDPMATGVLPVFVGGATRAADFAAAQEKEYVAGFTLGYATDTQDTTGIVLQKSDRVAGLTDVQTAMESLAGKQYQLPPMYSAVKVGGKKLYELARQGKTVERTPREITVHEIELMRFDETAQTGQVRIICSKGTYVRTLIHDMGERLHTLAVMSSLRRTRAGFLSVEECFSLDEIEQAAADGTVSSLFRPTDGLFSDCPAVTLRAEGAERIARGAVVFDRQTEGMPQQPGTVCRVYAEGAFWMLGQIRTLEIGGVGLFVYKNFR